MSVEEKTKAEGATDTKATPAAAAPPEQGKLAELMAAGPKGKAATAPDLEGAALKAAEAALAQGQAAIAEARAHLEQAPARGSKKRELALRTLLVINLLAMVGVMLWPTGAPATHEPPPTEAHDAAPAKPKLDDPYLRGLEAGDRGEWRAAIDHLEGYLRDTPRMAATRRASVLFALEHYALQLADFRGAEEYRRQAEALRTSARLPDDLLQSAREAEKSGDADAMRRVYARFLLQQRQIPPSLYKHVAEAYLKLGDSYRQEAQQAADAARRRELEEARSKLREEAQQTGRSGGGK